VPEIELVIACPNPITAIHVAANSIDKPKATRFISALPLEDRSKAT